jgi:electron transfer flavoprotein alpha subunit
VAARTGATLVTDCVDFETPDGTVVVTRPMYSGTVHTRLQVTGMAPYIVSFQKGSLEKAVLPPREAETIATPLAAEDTRELLTRIIHRREPPRGEVDLTTAEIIVAIGRGIGGAENVYLGKELAAALGAGLGCSRHLADQGWLPPHCHIGMEGQTVAPKVYLAFGISGAAHHVGGIRDSDLIIAVNKEANAPIFTVADYGVVGDLFEIIPALIETARGQTAA